MCLLVVVSRLDPSAPLVVGANRDERLDRPAVAMTVVRESGPRVLGGRDEEAGGTWLAVNEHGVVAGLTNRPSPDGVDRSKRTRGELPLMLAGHHNAHEAVGAFVEQVRPSDYNSAWLLVGDRTSLYSLDVSSEARPRVEELGPGVHILENNPLASPSAKVDHVRALLGDAHALTGDALLDRLATVLVDHTVAALALAVPDTTATDGETAVVGARFERPAATLAACVHFETYGTRSSTLVRVPVETGPRPTVRVADGHPCTSAFVDATGLWDADALS